MGPGHVPVIASLRLAGIVADESLDATADAAVRFWLKMSTMRPMATFETVLGRCGVAWTDRGIATVFLPRRVPMTAVPLAAGAPAFVQVAIDGMTALLAGASVDLRDIPIDDRDVDPFRRSVYAATRGIAPGRTTTYGAIARQIGLPTAARDVGTALSRNPTPIVVPCHRVIASTGALTGFSGPGGIDTKRRMLELEGAPGFGQQALFG